jgi:hypothetical protein
VFRRILAMTVLACAAVTFVVVGPAAAGATTAANPGHFSIPYGQTYTTGTVTFSNRNVLVAGEQKAVSSSGCRYTYAEAYDASGNILGSNRSQITCGGSETYSFGVPANVVGGASFVEVWLMYWVDQDNWRYLASAYVPR